MSRRPARSTVVAYTTLVRSGGEAGRLAESGGVDRGGQRGRGVGLADNLGHSRRSGGVEVAVIGVAGGDGVAADRKRIGAGSGHGCTPGTFASCRPASPCCV